MKYCICPYSLGISSAAIINQKIAVIPEPPVLAIANEKKPLILLMYDIDLDFEFIYVNY